jgi:hypothetical protein
MRRLPQKARIEARMRDGNREVSLAPPETPEEIYVFTLPVDKLVAELEEAIRQRVVSSGLLPRWMPISMLSPVAASVSFSDVVEAIMDDETIEWKTTFTTGAFNLSE